MKKRVALIDGDIVAHRAAAAVQQEVYWDDNDVEPTVFADAARAAKSACDTARAWTELAGCNQSIVFFTGRTNWRKGILSSYKANRAGKVKPLAYLATVKQMSTEFETRQVEGLEADDLIGIMGTRPQYEGAVMVSLDKDFRTIPGLHFNPSKERKPVEVTLRQADRQWFYQTLIGDSTDGYKGCPGVGPKKADTILMLPFHLDYAWHYVLQAFRAKGLTEADALVQARVARILRNEDYDKSTRSIRLWHPKEPEWETIENLVARYETTAKRASVRSGKTTGDSLSATEA